MKDKITAIILAGGQGTRFNHQDKGLIEWQGKTLTEHVINAIKPQVDHIIISCNRNLSVYRELSPHCCCDTISNFQGPLAGIQAGLYQSKTALNLILPCDSPKIPPNLVDRLQTSLKETHADISYVNDGKRDQYLIALIKADRAQSLGKYLTMHKRSVKGWYASQKIAVADFTGQEEYFVNINDPLSLNTLQL